MRNTLLLLSLLFFQNIANAQLLTVPGSQTGNEDTPIPLGISVDPVLTSGGQLFNVIGTQTGFRNASDGNTATGFTVPPDTTAIRITAFGGNNNGSASGGVEEEDYQTVTVIADLETQTYSGHIFSVIGQSTQSNDDYSFSNVPFGSSSISAETTGDRNNNLNQLTLDISGNSLSISQTTTIFDQSYLIEYLSSVSTSAEFLGSTGSFLATDTASETINYEASANYLILSIREASAGLGFAHEDKALGRIFVDLDTNTASGILFAQIGRSETQTASYGFSGYDITLGTSVLAQASLGGVTITGDAVADTNAPHPSPPGDPLSSLPEWTFEAIGNTLEITRSDDMAANFTSLVSTQSFERLAVGSNATNLGNSALSGDYIDSPSAANTFDIPFPGSAKSGVIEISFSNIVSVSNTNENSGVANIVVDLENETTSGSFLIMRTSAPDLVSWSNVPFGTRLIDAGPLVVSNHDDISDFQDELAGVTSFNRVTLPSGEDVLRMTATAIVGDGSATFRNYQLGFFATWSGRFAATVTGTPNGGSYNLGVLDPTNGTLALDPADLPLLAFTPNEHFSGNASITLNIAYRNESHDIDVAVRRVIDPVTISENVSPATNSTVVDIGTNLDIVLIDNDGSESISNLIVNGIANGDTVSDGSNSFTAMAINQDIDISTWNLANLRYEFAVAEPQVHNINLQVTNIDTDGFTVPDDSQQQIISIALEINDACLNGLGSDNCPDSDMDGFADAGVGTITNAPIESEPAFNTDACIPDPSAVSTLDCFPPSITNDELGPVTSLNAANYLVSGSCFAAGDSITIELGGVTASTVCSGSSFSQVIDASSLTGGIITLTTTISDGVNNPAQDVDNITVDLAPSISIDIPPAADTLNLDLYPVTGSCDADGDTVQIALGSATESATCISGSYSVVLDLSDLPEGDYVLTATIDDGINPDVSAQDTVALDIPPSITQNAAANITPVNEALYPVSGACQSSGDPITIEITDGSAASVSTTILCQLDGTYSALIDASSLQDGPATVASTISDTNSNHVPSVDSQGVEKVAQPSISIANPTEVNATNETAYSVTGACFPIGADISISVSDITSTNTETTSCQAGGTYSVVLDVTTLAEGPLTIDAEIDNLSFIDTAQAVVQNNQPPQISLDSLGEINPANADNFLVSGSCSASGDTIDLAISDGINTINGSTLCDAAGMFMTTIDISTLSEGSVNITANIDDGVNPIASANIITSNDTLPTIDLNNPVLLNTSNEALYPVTGTCSAQGDPIVLTLSDVSVPANQVTSNTLCRIDGTFSTSVNAANLSEGSLLIDAAISDANTTANDLKVGLRDDIPTISHSSLAPLNEANIATYSLSGSCFAAFDRIDIEIRDSAGSILASEATTCDSSGAFAAEGIDLSSASQEILVIESTIGDSNNNSARDIDTIFADRAPSVTIDTALGITPSNAGSYPVIGSCDASGDSISVVIEDDLGTQVSGAGTCQAGTYSIPLDVSLLDEGAIDTVNIDVTIDDDVNPVLTVTGRINIDSLPLVGLDSLSNITPTNELNYPISGACSAPGDTVTVIATDTAGVQLTLPISGTLSCELEGTFSLTEDVSSLQDGLVNIAVIIDDGSNQADDQTVTKLSDPTVTITSTESVIGANAANYLIEGECHPPTASIALTVAGQLFNVSCDANGRFGQIVDLSSETKGLIAVTAVIDDGLSTASNNTTLSVNPAPVINLDPAVDISTLNQSNYPVSGTCDAPGDLILLDFSDTNNNLNIAEVCGTNGTFNRIVDLSTLNQNDITLDASIDDGVNPIISATIALPFDLAPTITLGPIENVVPGNESAVEISGVCDAPGDSIDLIIDDGINQLVETSTCDIAGTFTLTPNLSGLDNSVLSITASIDDGVNPAEVDISATQKFANDACLDLSSLTDDCDGDGTPNYFENGRDTDGVLGNDAITVSDRELETSVSGGGSFGLGWVLMLFIAVVKQYRKRFKHGLMFVGLSLAAFGQSAAAECLVYEIDTDKSSAENCWYGGAALNITFLDPENSDGDGWQTDNSKDQDQGYSVKLGYRFDRNWFAELSYSDQGEAGLTTPNVLLTTAYPNANISYETYSLMAGRYLFDISDAFRGYAKAGVSIINNDAHEDGGTVDFEEVTSTQLALGLGLEYHEKTSPWFFRLNADYFDRDTSQIGVSINRYFEYKNEKRSQKPSAISKKKSAVTATKSTVANMKKESTPALVIDTPAEASLSTPSTTSACQRLYELAPSVYFAVASAQLNSGDSKRIKKFARVLAEFPGVQATIKAHTDNTGSIEYNSVLSGRRANAVYQQLIKEGASPTQLKTVALGEMDPPASNATPTGQSRNRHAAVEIEHNQCL